MLVHFLCPEASGENEPKEKALFRPDRSGFEGFFTKGLQKPAIKSFPKLRDSKASSAGRRKRF
jgi:hypothetical protein